MAKQTINIFWYRRDLRLHDNAALFHALEQGLPVVPVFIFDQEILEHLEDKKDRRVVFIHRAIEAIQEKLVKLGSSLEVRYGKPLEVFKALSTRYTIANVFTNHDYEPYAVKRDQEVARFIQTSGGKFHTYKDQVIFEKEEIMKDDGTPYSVFTPYSKKWKAVFEQKGLPHYDVLKRASKFFKQAALPVPSLSSIGFEDLDIEFPPDHVRDEIVKKYQEQRDFPGIKGTSRLSVHLRFGTISIRELVAHVRGLSEPFLNELIWREFYQMILWNFPQVGEGKAFKPQYDLIRWRNNEDEFRKWCEGQTGYPIVDAGMRELNATGFMHNRVRMVVASFLCKHLLIDWRWGEAYFADKLLDFDLASNNGGWQWASGSGCDAAPYFRIFNPRLQTEKFDNKLAYIRKWVPELEEFGYPKPIVDHEFARKRCLEVYKEAINK
ncbi:MAG TPA: deoxyribodipyrimidine photo-lyase [Chitinophagaceae bacterium]|nr:deoxyribodipyrimidine photo-lyase [Chitinophagaceae bacterium]